jgi:hypothetical protein
MDGDLGEVIGGLAEMFGLGELVKGVTGGLDAYGNGRSTETAASAEGVPYVYERVLTRPRELGINDR